MHRVFSYCPGKPRSTLMRLVFGMLGLLLLAFLLVFGIFIGAGMLLFAAARRLLSSRRSSISAAKKPDNVLDAEYSVVSKKPVSINAQ